MRNSAERPSEAHIGVLLTMTSYRHISSIDRGSKQPAISASLGSENELHKQSQIG